MGPEPDQGWLMAEGQHSLRRRLATGFVSVVALVLMVGCRGRADGTPGFGTPADGREQPYLRLDPPVANVDAGQRYWVEVRLDGGAETMGAAFEITFDPRYVRVEDSVPEAAGVQIRVDALCDSPLNVHQSVLQNEVDNEAGVIRYRSAWPPSRQLCEDALVASLDVRAVAEGGCPLRFAAAEVDSPDGESFPIERPGNGLILVNVAQDTPEAEGEPTEPAPAEPSAGDDGLYHIVQTGETIFGIAQQYGTTVDALVEANGLQDPDAVRVGQRLLIPPADGAEGPADRTTTYVVQPGDTLSSIAVRYGTTVEALAELNGLTPPYDIIAGETLRVR